MKFLVLVYKSGSEVPFQALDLCGFLYYIVNIYMLFAGWKVRMVKNCDLGLESIFKNEVTVFHHTDRPIAGK